MLPTPESITVLEQGVISFNQSAASFNKQAIASVRQVTSSSQGDHPPPTNSRRKRSLLSRLRSTLQSKTKSGRKLKLDNEPTTLRRSNAVRVRQRPVIIPASSIPYLGRHRARVSFFNKDHLKPRFGPHNFKTRADINNSTASRAMRSDYGVKSRMALVKSVSVTEVVYNKSTAINSETVPRTLAKENIFIQCRQEAKAFAQGICCVAESASNWVAVWTSSYQDPVTETASFSSVSEGLGGWYLSTENRGRSYDAVLADLMCIKFALELGLRRKVMYVAHTFMDQLFVFSESALALIMIKTGECMDKWGYLDTINQIHRLTKMLDKLRVNVELHWTPAFDVRGQNLARLSARMGENCPQSCFKDQMRLAPLPARWDLDRPYLEDKTFIRSTPKTFSWDNVLLDDD
ncbi:hypothetical protein CDD81_3877 [Ophiocordyceps australis]|uniref:Uncharacterized protein n=1 Tax=Ophiocordyceps australis TaxID=1399860 RepID=A0A2C5YD75_9HYPO|nr:hypothetical protein CDD81_3877 [Ophiocordyceps australis]